VYTKGREKTATRDFTGHPFDNLASGNSNVLKFCLRLENTKFILFWINRKKMLKTPQKDNKNDSNTIVSTQNATKELTLIRENLILPRLV
jgi:hypothetical protein